MLPRRRFESICSVLLLLLLLGVMFTTTDAEIEDACKSKLLTLQPCLPFVTAKAENPTTECCDSLRTIRANEPVCLCELISDGGSSYVSGLNISTLLALPVICKVEADVSKCTELLNGAPPPYSSFQKTNLINRTWMIVILLISLIF